MFKKKIRKINQQPCVNVLDLENKITGK